VAARSGEQFLQGLRGTKRQLWLEGQRVDDVTTHPALAGGAQTLAGIFDRLHAFPDECLVPDPETGEPLNVGHMIPRSIDDLKRRNRGLARIAEATVGLMGRTPDYMNVKFASFAGRWKDWLGADGRNEEGAHNLVAFQKRLARQDISLTHTIIHPTIDKATDARIVDSRVPVHKIAETAGSIVVRGARILATLAPYADEIAVYPAHPLPAGAEAYALAFSIPVDTPGLLFMCRDSAATPGVPVFDRPLSTRFDEQDAFVIFDDVEIPRERLFIDGRIDLYNTVITTGLRDNMTNQTTIRALTKLEFAYGLATRMAEAIGDASPATQEMLGELLDYVEVSRSAVLLSAEHGRGIGDLLDAALQLVPRVEAVEEPDRPRRIAIVGRPNVGKSSLLNRFLGEERALVSPIAGTTRDAVDGLLEKDGERYLFVDTAGIRRGRHLKENVDHVSVVLAKRSVERADVAILMLDAVEGMREMDAVIGGLVQEAGRAVVIAVNKWDLADASGLKLKARPNAAPG